MVPAKLLDTLLRAALGCLVIAWMLGSSGIIGTAQAQVDLPPGKVLENTLITSYIVALEGDFIGMGIPSWANVQTETFTVRDPNRGREVTVLTAFLFSGTGVCMQGSGVADIHGNGVTVHYRSGGYWRNIHGELTQPLASGGWSNGNPYWMGDEGNVQFDILDPGQFLTRTGRIAQAWRSIAVDESLIPLYSVVYIEELRNRSNGGLFVAEDTGSGIKGNHIDVFTDGESFQMQSRTVVLDRYLVRVNGMFEGMTNPLFWIQNRKYYSITDSTIIDSMSTLSGWEGKLWSREFEFTDKEVAEFFNKNHYIRGPDFITPDTAKCPNHPCSDGLLIRQRDADGFIFLVRNGVRKYISPDEFQTRGYDKNDIIDVTRKIIQLIPLDRSVPRLTLQEAVYRGVVLKSKGVYFGDGVSFSYISTGQNTEDVVVDIRVGDVILTKNPKEQQFVVTRNLEIFIPKGQGVQLEGIWIACIDRYKDPPTKGEELDVTLNLQDWPFESASRLLHLLKEADEKGLYGDRSTQNAVWEITDNPAILFPRLSNPNSSLPGTRLVAPPELSLAWFIARYIEHCPQGIENSDKIICQREIEFASWLYLNGQEVPGSAGRKIDLKTLREMVSYYITRTPIDRPSPRVGSQEVAAQLESLLGTEKVKELKVERVKNLPNPVLGTDTVRFIVEGQGIRQIKVQIFDLSGRRVFDSGEVPGSTFEWHLLNDNGQVVANGVYLYIVAVKGFNDEVIRSAMKKMVVLR